MILPETELGRSDDAFVSAYLHRLDVPQAGLSDLTRLRELHAAHLQHVPFENLSIHLDERLSLERTALAEKVLQRGRGGFAMS